MSTNSYNKNDPNWTVYIYELEEKYVYIGLTVDINQRHYEHRKRTKKDLLAKFCNKNNINLPSFKIIKEKIIASEAQRIEDELKKIL